MEAAQWSKLQSVAPTMHLPQFRLTTDPIVMKQCVHIAPISSHRSNNPLTLQQVSLLECKKRGSTHPFVQTASYDQFVDSLGYDLYAFPPKKLRKLAGSYSDGLNVFPRRERVDMLSDENETPCVDELEGLKDGSISERRKRRWNLRTLKWGACLPAGAGGAFLGLREIYWRIMKAGKVGDEVSSGDGGNGHGGGGFDGGNNWGSSGERGGSGEGLSMSDTKAFELDTSEDGDSMATNNDEIHDMDMASENLEGQPASSIEHVDSVSPEGMGAETGNTDNTSLNRQADLEGTLGDAYLEGINEHLRLVIDAFLSHLRKFLLQKKSRKRNKSLEPRTGAGLTYGSNNRCTQGSDDDDVLETVVGVEDPSKGEERESEELLEKLRMLKLESINSLDSINSVGNSNLKDRNMLKTILGLTAELPPTMEGLDTDFSAYDQLAPGKILGPMDRLVGSIFSTIAKGPKKKEASAREKQLEEEKLKQLIGEAVATALNLVPGAEGASLLSD